MVKKGNPRHKWIVYQIREPQQSVRTASKEGTMPLHTYLVEVCQNFHKDMPCLTARVTHLNTNYPLEKKPKIYDRDDIFEKRFLNSEFSKRLM